jgi:hypothetical protein
MTGGGFGGCIVGIADAASATAAAGADGWIVRAVDGAIGARS